MNERLFFAAMWVSEVWYAAWIRTGRIHYKTRGIVLHDRALNGRIEAK